MNMPDWAQELRTRLSSLRLTPPRENEIIDELSQHLDDRWEELVASGVSDEDARQLALAEFRGEDALAREMAPLRQAHSPASVTPGASAAGRVDGLIQDVRYAIRALRRRPGYALVAVLTLALGMGANAAIFSVVYGVLLRPLPFHAAERLVAVSHRAPAVGLAVVEQGPATYFTYRGNNRAFEDLGAWDSTEVSITGRGDPERVEGLMVTDGTLPLLGIRPVRGRLFTREDDRPGGPARVILTYGYWQRRFAGADDVVGQVLRINDTPREIVGVLPPSFRFLRTHPAVLMPMQLDRSSLWVVFNFQAVARLKAGVTLADANADVSRMLPLLVAAVPGFKEWRLEPNVHPLADEVVGNVGPTLWIVLATVGVVLLIACANVANLFLVRAEGRRNEFAVRAALGASRSRLARALLAESLTLALAGGTVGLILAGVGLDLLRAKAPSALPRVDELGIDAVVLAYTLGLSIFAGVVFGLASIARLTTWKLTALAIAGRHSADGRERNRLRNGLVVAEIALALVLMVVSGLMIRTFVSLRNVDPGFANPKQVQTFRIALTTNRVPDPRAVAELHQQIAERIQAVSGVQGVGLSSSITMDGDTNGNPTLVEHVAVASGTPPPLRRFKYIGAGYLETIGNRLVAGRHITWDDVQHAKPVVVISENLARTYWGHPSDALGKRVTNDAGLPWREIVGVAADAHDDGLNQPPTPIVYWPMLIERFGDGPVSVSRTMAYAVRSSRVGTPGFLQEIRQAVWSVMRDLPIANVQTLDEIQSESLAQTSFAMVLLTIAAAMALVLGVVGIYGVMAHATSQRTREIGIRMAVGAGVQDVRRMFLRRGTVLTLAGIVLGIAASLGLTRLMSSLLFGVATLDPLTYVVVSGLLACVALLATYLPAHRAATIDPVEALRSDL